MITQEQLKELIHYCPDSGALTWLVSRGSVRSGGKAGHKCEFGYIQISIKGSPYKAHRLAFLYMTGKFPPHGVDHDNGIKDDNRWSNIFAATAKENTKNKKRNHNNTSGATGVTWDNRTGSWSSRIGVNFKSKHLGRFDGFFEAVCARKSAELKYEFHANHGRNVRK